MLELTATYQPIDRDSLKAELEILEQSRYNDYLFLARKDRFRLMPLSEVYTAGSDANGFLTLFEVQTCWSVLALLLHVEYMESGVHRGSVILNLSGMWPFLTGSLMPSGRGTSSS